MPLQTQPERIEIMSLDPGPSSGSAQPPLQDGLSSKAKGKGTENPTGTPDEVSGNVTTDRPGGTNPQNEYLLGRGQVENIQRVQIEADRKGWAALVDKYRDYDQTRIQDVKEDIDTLLVFAGLFSAVLSAFVIETYPKLQDDSGDTTNKILMQMSIQLASLSVTNSFINSTQPSYNASATFSPPSPFVRINTLWSCSLIISLMTASFGILVKQWLHEFMAQDTQDPNVRIRVRFFRSEGLDKWQVFQISAGLPMLLQVALVLFFIGLSEFLIHLHHVVGLISAAFVILWASIFIFMTVAPMLSSQCPYKTPVLKGTLGFLRSLHLLTPVKQRVLTPIMQTIIRACRFPLLIHHALKALDDWIFPTRETLLVYFVKKTGKGYQYFNAFKLVQERKPPLEEKDVGGHSDSDLLIMNSSKILFRDDQIERTIGECSMNTPVAEILQSYRAATRSRLEAHGEIGEVFVTLLLHKCQYPDAKTQPIPDIIDSIMTAKEGSPERRLLPDLIDKLLQLDVDYQASLTFLTIYRAVHQGKFTMSTEFKLGGPQYVKQVLKVFQFLLDNLWPQNPSAKSARSMQFLIEELQIKPDLFLLFEVYRRILSLASPQVLGHYEVDRMKLEDRKWRIIIGWMESKARERDIWGPEMSANFLSIYTFIANCNDFAYNNLRKSFKMSPIRGDIRYLQNAIEIIKHVYPIFRTGPVTSEYSEIRTVLLEHGIPILYRTIDMLVSLADPESRIKCHDFLARFCEEIWDEMNNDNGPLQTDEYSMEIMYISVENGARSPLLALYSSSTQKSFDHLRMVLDPSPPGDSMQCLDNLISIAKSLMDLFWSVSTNPLSADEHLEDLVEKHGIERDVCAFCYTVSTLLWLASDENIAKREEELREISSRILRILPSEGDTEFVAKATRTTYRQLHWQGFDASRLIGIVDEGLVPKLRELRDKVDEAHNYDLFD